MSHPLTTISSGMVVSPAYAAWFSFCEPILNMLTFNLLMAKRLQCQYDTSIYVEELMCCHFVTLKKTVHSPQSNSGISNINRSQSMEDVPNSLTDENSSCSTASDGVANLPSSPAVSGKHDARPTSEGLPLRHSTHQRCAPDWYSFVSRG